MKIGKRICNTLKELRKRIADTNEIPFEMNECTHKGDCLGTCPKCEDEVSFIMDSLEKREQEGKPVVIEGLETLLIRCQEQQDCQLWEMCQIRQY